MAIWIIILLCLVGYGIMVGIVYGILDEFTGWYDDTKVTSAIFWPITVVVAFPVKIGISIISVVLRWIEDRNRI